MVKKIVLMSASLHALPYRPSRFTTTTYWKQELNAPVWPTESSKRCSELKCTTWVWKFSGYYASRMQRPLFNCCWKLFQRRKQYRVSLVFNIQPWQNNLYWHRDNSLERLNETSEQRHLWNWIADRRQASSQNKHSIIRNLCSLIAATTLYNLLIRGCKSKKTFHDVCPVFLNTHEENETKFSWKTTLSVWFPPVSTDSK